MIKVNANLFRLVYGAISTEETRYYLNGVHVEAHPTSGALLVSTDGHRMIVAYDREGICDGTAIVKLTPPVLSQCKPSKEDETDRQLVISISAKTATVEIGDRVVAVSHDAIIAGNFPNWRKVVPKEMKQAKAAPTVFAPQYLGDWAKLGADIKKTIPGASGAVQIALSDGASPVLIRFGTPSTFAVLMPLRGTIEGFLPPFMAQADHAQIAAE